MDRTEELEKSFDVLLHYATTRTHFSPRLFTALYMIRHQVAGADEFAILEQEWLNIPK
jgi:hypothetical protein